MKITLKNTPEQCELIKAVGSKDPAVSIPAQQALAAFISTVIQSVLQQAGTVGAIYEDLSFNEDDNPTIPLDLYYNVEENWISTWSQNMAGGLPTSQIEGIKEMKIGTYRIDTAVSWAKKYARKSRLDVISKAIERMAQEILIKQERNGWAVVLKAVAEASTLTRQHILKSKVADVFHVNDLSRMITLLRRIHASWAKGTPVGFDSKGLTDLFVSPEIKEQIRAYAFNAMNTVGAASTALTSNDARNNGIPLPDAIREQIFRAGGASEFYGVTLTDLNELGTAQRYNILFSEFAKATDYDSANRSAVFSAANDEVLIGLDLTKRSFIRPVSTQADSGGQFVTLPDDQFYSTRADMAGLYGYLEEGRVCIDARSVCAIIV
jgi:hypothetical protein